MIAVILADDSRLLKVGINTSASLVILFSGKHAPEAALQDDVVIGMAELELAGLELDGVQLSELLSTRA